MQIIKSKFLKQQKNVMIRLKQKEMFVHSIMQTMKNQRTMKTHVPIVIQMKLNKTTQAIIKNNNGVQ
jgi:hypothetical protein